MEVLYVVVAIVVTAIIVAPIAWKTAISYHQKVVEAKVGSAEEKAKEIIDEAVKTAEVQRYEKRVLQKEETLDRKMETLEKRESKLVTKEQELDKLHAEVEEAHQQQVDELEKISGLTSEQAKEYLIKTVEDEVKHETAVLIKDLESKAKEEADKN